MWQLDTANLNTKNTKSTPEVGGYYSNPQRLYLTYENTLDFGPVDTLQYETDALQSALYIGHLLNRTVILPWFRCHGCYYRNQTKTICGRVNSCSTRLRYFNKTANYKTRSSSNVIHSSEVSESDDHCSLNAHFIITSFYEQFFYVYREHGFLKHPKVPNVVKLSHSSLILIESQVSTRRHLANVLGNNNIFTPADLKNGATRAEILSWFTPYRDLPLLRFHSLYGATSQLKIYNIDDDIIFN